ncbi:MAG TPA: serine/threonine-protein kinase [Pirellulales bacterium]|nr:serine/threonine-protein kinase [Pirellulales bacterium]
MPLVDPSLTGAYDPLATYLTSFVQAWQARTPPSITTFLAALDETAPRDARRRLLESLVAIDLEHRWKLADSLDTAIRANDDSALQPATGGTQYKPRLDAYQREFPELGALDSLPLNLIESEYRARHRWGDRPSHDEYAGRFPSQAAALLDQLAIVDLELARDGGEAPSRVDSSSTHVEASQLQLPASKSVELPRIPGYEVLGLLGRGGMGVVLKARHCVLGRLVAIKLPLAGQLADAVDRERFLREARAAARLRHPHICPIYEVGETEGRPYLALHFVAGQTLRDWSAERSPSAREVAELLARVARAVGYAHEHGVVHRDLKPANVMIEAETGQPVLMDFGLAKELGDEASLLTHSGQVMGTPAYMAPEQAAGRIHDVGPLADVYALGAVLYEMLCARPPFQGSVGEVLSRIQAEEPPSPRSLNVKIHRDLETICLKALAKEPAARYGSAIALAEDLDRFSAGEPILARRRGVAARVLRKVRRSPALAATVLALAATIGVAGYVAVRTGRTMRLTRLNQAFEAGLDDRAWSPEHLERMESLAADSNAFSLAEVASARERLYQRYTDFHHGLLKHAALEPADEARVEQASKLLAKRDEALAAALRQALNERRRAWETVVHLSVDTDPEEVFTPGVVSREDGNLRPVVPAGQPPDKAASVVTRGALRGNIEVEAEFGRGWLDAAELGLRISMQASLEQPMAGYVFRFAALGRSAPDPPERSTERATFALARRGGALFRMEILREGARLTSHDLSAAEWDDGALRLFASRQGDRLTFQVDKLVPLEFFDVFPLGRDQAASLAVVWPRQAPLTSLRAKRQAQPTVASPLELGDDAYGRGDIAKALEAYQRQAITSVGTPAAQEARYKEAICFVALERHSQAQELLESVAAESGDRWPVLAACELWLGDLRAQRFKEADQVFDGLSTRYRFEQLATMIPVHLRQQILAAYNKQATGLNWYSQDASRVRNLERAVDVESLLGSEIDLFGGSRWSLLRGYHVAGRFDDAVRLAEQMLGDYEPAQVSIGADWVTEYAWLLCLRGEPAKALDCLDKLLVQQRGVDRGTYHVSYPLLLLARVRARVAMEQWGPAEDDIEEMFGLLPPGMMSENMRPMACLVRGLLRERRGDLAGARAAWKDGLLADHARPLIGTTRLAALILASLIGEVTDAEAARMMTSLLGLFADDSPLASIGAATRLPPAVIREMWRTRRGHAAAWKIAFREVSLADCMRLAAVVMAGEAARQTAFGGEFTAEQESLVWELMDEIFTSFISAKINKTQALQCLMTWKGITNFAGWGGLAPTLAPDLRGRLAYVLGQRYRHLPPPIRPADAAAFFRTAVDDSAPFSVLRRLAEAELERLGMVQ